ncbi:MAG: HupE/UreJ family protein [Alphaproteobacteria bacterium]
MLVFIASLTISTTALAHEVRPALVQINQTAPGSYQVTWKQPVVGDMAVRMVPHLSSGVLDKPVTTEEISPAFRIRTWDVKDGAPLDGQTLTIEGLKETVTDVLVRITPTQGTEINTVIHPSEAAYRIVLSGPAGMAVPAYLRLGIEHILTGFDHLMFVLGLLLLIGTSWRIVKAVTAFTVAHSLTLALAALGFVKFPTAIIEALVALSIVFVASELLISKDTLTRRRPWLIAFVFGLLHGLAFAGALSNIGLPPHAEPQALFLFNVGVEIGQLAFITTAVAVILILRSLRQRLSFNTDTLARLAPAYVIGGFAAYWLIERTLAAMS